jgi:type IV pilus assembly protein PilC
MIYPAILFILSISVVIFLLIKVMPTFVNLYNNSGVHLPMATTMLLNTSKFIKNTWFLILLLILSSAVFIFKAQKINSVKYRLDSLKLKIPLYKKVIINRAVSRFTRTLSVMISSGVPLLDALDSVSNVTGNSFIGKSISDAREDLCRGASLSQSLEDKSIFPKTVTYMIRIGEDSGNMEGLLDNTADFYDEEVENSLQRFIALIEPMMILFLALNVGFIVLAMVTPMFDMIRTVQ